MTRAFAVQPPDGTCPEPGRQRGGRSGGAERCRLGEAKLLAVPFGALIVESPTHVGRVVKQVTDVDQFVASVRKVAAGSTVMDPDVVRALLTHRSTDPKLLELSPREHEVLTLMAQGRSNAAIAARMFVTEKTVSKHSNSIFTKLGLKPSEDDNRRILAVLAYLQG